MTDERQPVPDWADMIAERDAKIAHLTEENADIRRLANKYLAESTALKAEVARKDAALRDAYEVYAGSDGFIPETAAEGYQQQIIKQMVGYISAALNPEQEPRT